MTMLILEDIMDTNVIYASTTDDQEEVSEMISRLRPDCDSGRG